jgi:hypothetical protein
MTSVIVLIAVIAIAVVARQILVKNKKASTDVKVKLDNHVTGGFSGGGGGSSENDTMI